MNTLYIIFLFISLTIGATSAGAQSVLERVLGKIDGANNLAAVNGVYANIAETLMLSTSEQVEIGYADAPPSTLLWALDEGTALPAFVTVADVGKSFSPSSTGTPIEQVLFNYQIDSLSVAVDGSLTIKASKALSGLKLLDATNTTTTFSSGFIDQTFTLDPSARVYYVPSVGYALVTQATATAYLAFGPPLSQTRITSFPTTIDGSITNIISGFTGPTSIVVVGKIKLVEYTISALVLGDMSTTALGAVNTGNVTLGVNSAVDEANTLTTRAMSAAMTQIGGSSDTGALVLNVASNASAVNGAINNSMSAVNGSIVSASTTALGSVNTGAIMSGLNAAVHGVVGMSGQSGSGL